MQIDIRDSEFGKVKEIVFADKDDTEKNCYLLTLQGSLSKIRTGWDGEDSFVYLDSKTDALNLIKALQKAIELGNWGE